MVAVNLFLKINRRIAAWQTATSVKRLVESVYSSTAYQDNVPTTEIINMLGMLQYKGVGIFPDTLKLVASKAVILNDPILNTRLVRIIKQSANTNGDAVNEILSEYTTLSVNIDINSEANNNQNIISDSN
jgi:hypothetical protein